MRVHLIRHAQTAWNAEGRAQGHADIELDEEGKAQAKALGRAYRGKFEKVLTSDLRRSAETARALECPQTLLDPRLRERSFGKWEGMTFEEFHPLIVASGKSHFEFVPPEGESFSDVWDRPQPVAEELFEAEESVAIVTHGGTCSVLLAQLLKGTPGTTRGFRFFNTGVTELQKRGDGSFVLVRYNDASHLRRPAKTGGSDGSHR